jgi:hypothetical protein
MFTIGFGIFCFAVGGIVQTWINERKKYNED